MICPEKIKICIEKNHVDISVDVLGEFEPLVNKFKLAYKTELEFLGGNIKRR